MNNLRRCLTVRTKFHSIKRLSSTNLYEPDYLELMKPKVPLYDTLNIQMRGYDFSILENYQKFVHRIVRNLDINAEDCWATPAQDLQICTYKRNSEIVVNQYALKNYERTVQITDVSGAQLQVLLRALDASAPEGVTVQVLPHEEYHDKVRYLPDQELKELKEELETIGVEKKKKKK